MKTNWSTKGTNWLRHDYGMKFLVKSSSLLSVNSLYDLFKNYRTIIIN
ncbi:hypothetical protein [Virgibacillus indicus]|nr:hypothetical protein [Virgibacillus indicus]